MCAHMHRHILEIWVCTFQVITLSHAEILKKHFAGVNRLKGQRAFGYNDLYLKTKLHSIQLHFKDVTYCGAVDNSITAF